jgi:hypothetical protein
MATEASGDQGGSSGGPGDEAATVDADFFSDVKFFVSGTLDDQASSSRKILVFTKE